MTGFTVAVAARRAWAGAIEPPIVGPATTICHHLKRVVEVTCLIEHEDLFNRAQDALPYVCRNTSTSVLAPKADMSSVVALSLGSAT
jgi:hypothetical protein